MALSRITDISPQVIHEIQNIFDEIESVLAPGGGSGLGDPGGNGILVRTALGVTDNVSLVAPAAGFTITNPSGVSGGAGADPTFALANDLAALEALSGTGFAKRTGSDTWSVGALVSGDIPDLSGTYQPLDGDLTAIAALAGTSGLPRKTAANTWSLDTSTYATQAYADALVVGLLDDRGNYDASGNTFPASGGSGSAGAILKGDLWTVSVAGTLGGVAVNIGDQVRALTDAPGQTASNWAISEANIGYVPLSQSLADGKVYVGNGSGIGTAVTPSGDVTITNAGVTAIGALKVTNAMLAGSIDLTTKITGVLPSANGGTGINNAGRTLTINTNSGTLAFPGAGTVMTFPSTNATIARSDASNTFTGNQTFAGHVLPSTTDTYDLGSSTLLWRKGWLSELDAVLFAQNTMSVIGGWLVVTKDEGTVEEDVDTSETQIDFGANAIAANDFIVFRSAGAVEYMQATSLVSGTTWNVTRNVDGSGANAWPQGSVWVNFGYNGTGRIELNANATPRISMFTQGTTYNAQTELLRVGDLNGGWGYGSVLYGFATGQYGAAGKAWETIEPTNGIRLGVNTTTLFKVDTSGNVTMGEVATNQGNVFWNISNKRLEFRGSTAGTVVQAYVDTTGAIKFGGGLGTLDASGLSLVEGTGIVSEISWYTALASRTATLASFRSGSSTNITVRSLAGSGGTDDARVVLGAVKVGVSEVQFDVQANFLNVSGESAARIYASTGTFKGLMIGASGSPTATLHVAGDTIVSEDAWIAGILTAGNPATTLTNSAGKILSAALNTVAVAQGGTGDTGTAWTAWTPTVVAGTGAFTTVSAAGSYKTIGKTVFFNARVTITTNGTAGSYVEISLPVATVNNGRYHIVAGRETSVTSLMLTGALAPNSSAMYMTKYDGTYPGGSGFTLDFSGSYESA